MAMLKNFVGTIPTTQLVETNIPKRGAPANPFVSIAMSIKEITKQSAGQIITLFAWYTSIIARKRERERLDSKYPLKSKSNLTTTNHREDKIPSEKYIFFAVGKTTIFISSANI